MKDADVFSESGGIGVLGERLYHFRIRDSRQASRLATKITMESLVRPRALQSMFAVSGCVSSGGFLPIRPSGQDDRPREPEAQSDETHGKHDTADVAEEQAGDRCPLLYSAQGRLGSLDDLEQSLTTSATDPGVND